MAPGVDLPPELAPAQRAAVEALLAEVPLAYHREHTYKHTDEPTARGHPCWVCKGKSGPKGLHHLVPGDHSSVVPVHKSCHRSLHPR